MKDIKDNQELKFTEQTVEIIKLMATFEALSSFPTALFDVIGSYFSADRWHWNQLGVEEQKDRIEAKDFTRVNFQEISFGHCAKLHHIDLGLFLSQNIGDFGVSGDLRGFDLSYSELSGKTIPRLVLENGVMKDADCKNTDFGVSRLNNLNCTGSDMKEANLSHCSLKGINLTRSDLRGSLLGRMKDACVDWANMSGLNFDQFSTLLRIEPGYDNDDQAATLKAPLFFDRRMVGVNCTGADLSGLYLKGYKLDSANCTAANLQGTYLMEATVDKTDFTEADLRRADLTGVDLTVVKSLDGADMRGAILKRTRVNVEQFQNVQIDILHWYLHYSGECEYKQAFYDGRAEQKLAMSCHSPSPLPPRQAHDAFEKILAFIVKANPKSMLFRCFKVMAARANVPVNSDAFLQHLIRSLPAFRQYVAPRNHSSVKYKR